MDEHACADEFFCFVFSLFDICFVFLFFLRGLELLGPRQCGMISTNVLRIDCPNPAGGSEGLSGHNTEFRYCSWVS